MAKRKMHTRKRSVSATGPEMFRASAKKPENDVKPRAPSMKQRTSRMKRLEHRKI